MANRTGLSSGWEYVNRRTQRDFLNDVSGWYATFMTPIGIVANALGGEGGDKQNRPKGPSAYTKPRPQRIPAGANVINLGGQDEAPSPQALAMLRGMYGKGASVMSASETKAAVTQAEQWPQLFEQQQAKYDLMKRLQGR